MTTPARSPHDRIALITGAGDRLGAAMARRLAREGFAVVIHYRSSAAAAESVRDEILAGGGLAATEQADLSVRAERAALIAAAAGRFGPLTLLVNNASAFVRDAAGDVDEALWDLHFAVHVEAPVFLSRDFVRQLPPGRSGNIVNIIDERVLHTGPAHFSYTLSKSALWSATRTMAQSYAPQVRVNAIGPGPTLPAAGQTDEQFRASTNRVPLKRGATPEEIADGLIFILSAPSMTGQMLALDGGEHVEWSAHRGPTPRK